MPRAKLLQETLLFKHIETYNLQVYDICELNISHNFATKKRILIKSQLQKNKKNKFYQKYYC